ncbi:hypothetical protein HD806DRAFT_492010, partial [Xylariaceae sp. AK1471]
MPLSRESSQRALNWVRRNPSKTSLNSNKGPKRAAEPEIIHLGGARVGTAFEVLDLPAPDRSKPTERPLTQWTFDPPPPNPPGIGIAIASLDSSKNETSTASDLDSDRPITQWFHTLEPGGETSKNESPDLVLQTAYPYANSNADAAEEKLLSPLTPGPSSIATSHASSASLSPSPSSLSSPVDFPETNPSRAVQFPKRSTSLSQASRHAPPRMPTRFEGESFPLRAKEIQLRRTQSNADAQKPPDVCRVSPPPISQDNKECLQLHEASPPSPKTHDAERNTRSPPKHVNRTQDSRVLPPLTSAPPNTPLPPISATKLAGYGKTRRQLHRRGSSSGSSDRSKERSPPRELPELADGQQPGTNQKLTSKERFWLHRHYRGEATFLKAWGLDITSEDDREEGLAILRELMDGETQEEKESQESQRMHHRSGSVSRSSTATSSSGRDAIGLDVIAEERQSREFPSHSATESLDYAAEAENEFWKAQYYTGDQRPKVPIASFSTKRPGLEKHSRTESESSVLGAYLDLRLSHH